MKENFNYNDIPKAYLYCRHTLCPRSAECLRFRVSAHIDNNIPHYKTVNPAYVIGRENDCPFFKPDSTTRYALGITNLYVNLPYNKARKLKKEIIGYFGRSVYYRVFRKERLITPGEQTFIGKTFLKEGIEEKPLFDEYIDRYDW